MQLTPRAQQALENAVQLSRDLGHSRVSSQHIVFGLFQLGSGVHFSILRKLGFTSDSLRRAILAEPPVGPGSPADPTFDLSASAALKRAEEEAIALGHGYTGTEHMLLALLSEEHGGAAHLFASNAVDLAKTRKTILHELGG
jgi:ATP-dependent Clp protease ATP-binding subunit ClpC